MKILLVLLMTTIHASAANQRVPIDCALVDSYRRQIFEMGVRKAVDLAREHGFSWREIAQGLAWLRRARK